jgi:hypothetical protein
MTTPTNADPRPRSVLLVRYLHQTRTAEHTLAGLLVAPRMLIAQGGYHRLCVEQTELARERLHDLDARLAVLGHLPGGVPATLSAVRHLADDTVAMSLAALTAGLVVARHDRIEPELIDLARAQAAATALAGTAYHALAEAARADDDVPTARIGTSGHAATVRLLRALDDAVPALTSQACRTAGSRASCRDTATVATARLRGAADQLGADIGRLQRELRDTLTGLWRRAGGAPRPGESERQDAGAVLPLADQPESALVRRRGRRTPM